MNDNTMYEDNFYVHIFFGHMLCVIIYHIMHMLFLSYHEFYGMNHMLSCHMLSFLYCKW
jgi:hypothetical protein